MINRSFLFGLLAAILFALPVVARAQLLTGVSQNKAGVTYVGPIDIVASPTAFYSLRAGSAAIAAAGTQSIVDLRRASDNATCTPIVATSGGVDLTVGTPCNSSTQTVTAWATRGTFTGALASTALTTTGDSCVAAVGDQITGTGITSYTTITVKTSCAAGSGVYTVSQGFSISAEAMTAFIPTAISKCYDQSGNLLNQVQGTAANQPQLVFNAIGALPALSGSTSLVVLTASTNTTPATGVVFFSAVGNRSVGTGAFVPIRENGNSNRILGGAANLWALAGGGGGNFSGAATDGAFHAANGTVNGASSVLNIDGIETAGTITGNTTAGSSRIMGVVAASTTILMTEAGFWDNLAPNATLRGQMQLNQKAYFGTP